MSRRTTLTLCAALACLPSCGDCGGAAQHAARDAGVRVARDAGPPDLGAPDLGPPDAGVRFADPDPVGLEGGGSFFEVPDGDIRQRLATQPVTEIHRGYGGRSVAFKLTLADGTLGYYKPEQTFSSAHWYSEIAAYHLDRLLGFHRVPPAVSRRMRWDDLRKSAPSDDRFPEVIVAEDGTVRGSFSFWVPDRLAPLRSPSGWERWVRITGWGGQVSPFQRPRAFTEALAARRDGGVLPAGARASDPDTADRAAELSDVVVFDYLTANTDRWGGDNANVLTRGRGGPLVFLDNGAGFPPGSPSMALLDARLHVVQRFRGRTIDALRAIDERDLARRLAGEPLAPVLDESQLAGFASRRRAVLDWVGECVARQGAQDTLAW